MTISIKPKPLNPSRGQLIFDQRAMHCSLGRSGISAFKREGDGRTPIIMTRPCYGFYRPDRENRPISQVPFFPLSPDLGWCDAPGHPSYNQPVRTPFDASHESMWREDALYDLVIVLDINISERVKGRGSALFMHVARDEYRPTEGCIALGKRDLRRLISYLTPKSSIRIGC